MIRIEKYQKSFCEEYWDAVNQRIGKADRTQILKSCKKFLPPDFFDVKSNEEEQFKELILASYAKIRSAENYIKNDRKKAALMKAECFDRNPSNRNKAHLTDRYFCLYNAFGSVADAIKDGKSIRVRIVENAELTVCPYCNRDYINSRAKKAAGAQLDHFFSRSKYPIFAVCLYNLVPVCGNCNRIKSADDKEFASPFDEKINFNEELSFSYEPQSVDGVTVQINTKNSAIQNNLDSMKIKEAYQIHKKDVEEILEKMEMYSKTQTEEIQDILKDLEKFDISEKEIKKTIFGPPISEEDMRVKSLGKMYYDLYKEMKIYP